VGEVDLITALGQLLADRHLRDAFERDPDTVALRLRVKAQDRALFSRLDPHELEVQARTLLRKRLHEVRQLLPMTARHLASTFNAAFLEYAETRWPQGHRRHLLDACDFSRHLERRGLVVCRSEANRARFEAARARLRIGLVPNPPVRGGPSTALQVLYRGRRRRTAEIMLFLG
jgi:hypothetical protein